MKPVRSDRPCSSRAFTLIELLVVISIIGLLAGLAVPVVRNYKPNVVDGAARQLLDDVARARQLAISQRTTIFMVFVTTNFWNDPSFPTDQRSLTNASRLYDKQLIAYNFVSLRSLGDQPGKGTPHYYGPWKTLPEGVYIPPEKFQLRNNSKPVYTIFTNGFPAFKVFGFYATNNLPFPAEDTPAKTGNRPYVQLPYVAFNYLGQLVSGQNEYIPITKGAVLFQRDPASGNGTNTIPAIRESPVGNVTNAFNVVSIDWLTGRAHLERQQVQ